MAKLKYPLIIVDVQAAFTIPPKVLAGIEHYSKRFEWRIFTRFVVPKKSIFRSVLGMDSCAPGSPDLRLLIKPSAKDLVLDKHSYGLSQSQILKLRALGVTKAVVCGLDTDACVLGTMFSLFDGGIACRVAPSRYCFSNQNLDTEARKIIEQQFPSLLFRR